jgi:ATP-dependent helicase/nuclease subunit B
MPGPVESACITLLPPQADFIDWAAERLIDAHRRELPDLSSVRLLVPGASASPELRQRLAIHSRGVLLGPRIQTLAQFADEFACDLPPLTGTECQLLLVSALRRYRRLFPGQNPWRLAEALYSLFEELSLHAVAASEDETAFTERLARAYGARPLAALSDEAQIIHRLWQAFREETGGRSASESYLRNLRRAFEASTQGDSLYLLGIDHLTTAERAIVAPSIKAGQVQLWLHAREAGRDGAAMRALFADLGEIQTAGAPTSARSSFLDVALAESRGDFPSGAHPQLQITRAEHPEHEARCVELAVREALLADCRDVAVVTEDRRLARRLRALLERAGIALQDEAGWALSTSAAAAALNSWLETIESRFHFRPLLSLLKSSFVHADPNALRILERDIIVRQGIESGLDRLRSNSDSSSGLRNLLDRCEQAARAMPSLTPTRPAPIWIQALEESLVRLGLWPAFQNDIAGRCLIATLTELKGALLRHPQTIDWNEFRSLLNRNIEHATFTVPRAKQIAAVRLLTLEQSSLLRCDAVILAGASRAQIPGAPPGEPFFNQSVRCELGLPGLAQRQTLTLLRLRRVLEAAPRVRITYAPEQAGEPAQLCPWLEAIESAAASRGFDLREPGLAQRAGTAAVEIADRQRPLPAKRWQPAPPAPALLLRERISATAHQTLIDCPYRYFARELLGLTAEQAPDEDPDRSDYGQRVHRILQAFVEPVSSLPPPFGQPVTAANRAQAQAHLERLAEAVFAPDLQSRALAHIWLIEFRGAIPELLDWLGDREATHVQAEVRLERELDVHFRLDGQADRLEQLEDGRRVVVDYKTGAMPRATEVESGEAVQLLHYALLDHAIARVEYLSLKEPKRSLSIEGDLAQLRTAIDSRLHDLLNALRRAAPLPANGEESICERCDFRGLCRKGDWVSRDDAAPQMTAEIITLPRRARKPSP